MEYKQMVEALIKEHGIDYILDSYQCRDFTDFVVSIGGDVIKYRYYNDGRIYEK